MHGCIHSTHTRAHTPQRPIRSGRSAVLRVRRALTVNHWIRPLVTLQEKNEGLEVLERDMDALAEVHPLIL